MKLLIVFGLIAIANSLTLAPSLAQPGQQVNGCGPDGILGRIIPNRSRLLNCQLQEACNSHDICYAKCLRGGELFNNPTCNDERERQKRRIRCDEALFSLISFLNQNRFACRMVASLYKSAVRTFGNTLFAGYRLDADPHPDSDHDTYTKEELYRAPTEYFQDNFFGGSSGVPVDEMMRRNYDAVEAFVRYAESAPGRLSQAEIDAAIESVAANSMRGENYVLEFRSSQSGAELILKPVELPEVLDRRDEDDRLDDTERLEEEAVIWKSGQ